MNDPREAAAQYRADKELREAGLLPGDDGPRSLSERSETKRGGPSTSSGTGGGSVTGEGSVTGARTPTAADRAAYVETAIQQAIRRGEFDNLPGAGKPLEGLGAHHDADWWIRRKIETEQLRGLGPPALMLRVENAEFDERLDTLSREAEVREYVEDFNTRVIEARRQLLGGPPVVTPTRDVDEEVAEWTARREARPLPRSSSEQSGTEGGRRRGLFRRARP